MCSAEPSPLHSGKLQQQKAKTKIKDKPSVSKDFQGGRIDPKQVFNPRIPLIALNPAARQPRAGMDGAAAAPWEGKESIEPLLI